jgi:transposase
LGEDEKKPYVEYDPRLPPPVYLPEVRVVTVRQIMHAIEQVLTIYRGEPNVERFARHLADKIEAMAQPIKPVVSAEVRDPKELMK